MTRRFALSPRVESRSTQRAFNAALDPNASPFGRRGCIRENEGIMSTRGEDEPGIARTVGRNRLDVW